MRLHAYVRGSRVEKIESISESQWIQDISNYEAIIDIEDIEVRPLVGWTADSALNFEPAEPLSSEQALSLQQIDQRIYGYKLAESLTDKVGSRNLLLSSQGESVNVSSLLQTLGGIKGLMETGALKTARGAIQSVKPMLPLYEDILDAAIASITAFLVENDYE